MTDIQIQQVNEAFIQITAEPHILMELGDDFTFFAPGYQHSPKYKKKQWDGRIRLFHQNTRLIYSGLKYRVGKWAEEKGYSHDIPILCNAMWPKTIENWFNKVEGIPFLPKDYQHEILCQAVHANRGTIVSATGSGKSFIIYLLMKWYTVKKTLIVVPTLNLVGQMFNDFISYGFESEIFCHCVHEGIDPRTPKPVVISTWQSLIDLPPEYFEQFELVFVDEAHGAKAKSIVQIMTQCVNAHFRFGLTGTLNEPKVHQLVLEGLFGPIIQGRPTRELIAQKHLADVHLTILVLEYPEHVRKQLRKAKYHDEIDFLVSYEPRQRFIRNLALSIKGSTFVLFRLVDKHGKLLYDSIREVKQDDCQIVWGDTQADEREITRLAANDNDNLTVVASEGVFAGGVNVPNLKNIIASSPSKAKTRILQGMGRALRRTERKQNAEIYDIVDNLEIGSHKNYAMLHFLERIRIYNQELHPYKIIRVQIKEPIGQTKELC